MARSFFILATGANIRSPKEFQLSYAPQLLTQQDLWYGARQCPPSLLFRVRSEDGKPEEPLKSSDTLESCVGLVDAGTRWRSIFRMVTTAVAGIHDTALAQACGQAVQFMTSTHPAGVAQAQRRAVGEAIMKAAEGEGVSGAEQRIAQGIAALAQADNDIEASFILPFVAPFMPYDAKEMPAEYSARLATIETISGAVLITEAATRLAERSPIWMFAPMPSLGVIDANAKVGVRTDAGEDDDLS